MRVQLAPLWLGVRLALHYKADRAQLLRTQKTRERLVFKAMNRSYSNTNDVVLMRWKWFYKSGDVGGGAFSPSLGRQCFRSVHLQPTSLPHRSASPSLYSGTRIPTLAIISCITRSSRLDLPNVLRPDQSERCRSFVSAFFSEVQTGPWKKCRYPYEFFGSVMLSRVPGIK